MNDTLLVPALLGTLVASLALGVWLGRRELARNPLRERLQPRRDAMLAGDAEDAITLDQSPLAPWASGLAAFGERFAGTAQDRAALRSLLGAAGWHRPEALGLLMTAKHAGGLLCLVIALWGVLGPASRFGLSGLAVGLLALFAGSTAPELLVRLRAARRHESLQRSMPDALDLMVICAEAGLPFPRILKVVSRELALSAPVMAEELAHTSAELQLLPDRTQALRRLAARTRVPTVESMVASLIQAERYGTPLAQALRTIADESRSTLILALEERAGKLPAQLSLPLMTLILPPVVALVATPALMRVIRSLMS
ncbi:MAG: type II secretion system F family protein [Candidatus Dactylopiibacterium sp.]|nr:type II secretion system F family protein [Candidatus Dactylopiibacterium sp.]